MLDQKTVERSVRFQAPREKPVPRTRGVAELTNDLLHLAELQLDLLRVDLKEFLRGSAVPLILMGAAGVLLLGCVPAVILTIVWAATDGGTSGVLTTLLVVLGVGGLLIAGLGVGGYFLLSKALAIPKRSFYELKRNINWARESLKQHVSKEL